MKKDIKKIDIRLGNIAYPKSEAIIIPSNTVGLMSRGVALRILKDSLGSVRKEAKKIAKETELKIGTCFRTTPGRLKRRGLKNMYHAVVKRFPNDITTIKIITDTLEYSIKKAIQDKNKSISICGLGIEDGDLEKNMVAQIFILICKKYCDKIDIKILDDDAEFISILKNNVEN